MTINDVFRTIKEMSAQEPTPRPVISLSSISRILNIEDSLLTPVLTELSDLKLIKFNDMAKSTVTLTFLGSTVTRKKA